MKKGLENGLENRGGEGGIGGKLAGRLASPHKIAQLPQNRKMYRCKIAMPAGGVTAEAGSMGGPSLIKAVEFNQPAETKRDQWWRPAKKRGDFPIFVNLFLAHEKGEKTAGICGFLGRYAAIPRVIHPGCTPNSKRYDQNSARRLLLPPL